MKFKRVVNDFGKLSVVECEGKKFVDRFGTELILYHDIENKNWCLIDKYTGLAVCKCKTKKHCFYMYATVYEKKYHDMLNIGYSKGQEKIHKLLLEGDEQ